MIGPWVAPLRNLFGTRWLSRRRLTRGMTAIRLGNQRKTGRNEGRTDELATRGANSRLSLAAASNTACSRGLRLRADPIGALHVASQSLQLLPPPSATTRNRFNCWSRCGIWKHAIDQVAATLLRKGLAAHRYALRRACPRRSRPCFLA